MLSSHSSAHTSSSPLSMDTSEDTPADVMSGKAPPEADSGRVILLSKPSAIDGKMPIDVDGLVRHMVDGAQRVADVDELSEAALKSFEIIAQWYAETSVSSNPPFANKARAMGKDYIEAVKESVKVAGLGVAFAADVVNLCDYVSKGRDTDIRSFMDEMRMIVQQALDETATTNHKFRNIRKRLVQLMKEIPVQQRRIKQGHNNLKTLSDYSREQDHINALEKVSDDMGHLVDGVAKFAKWWSQAKSMLFTSDTQMFVNDQNINPIRLDMAQKSWESYSLIQCYNVIRFQIDTLADSYPVDNMRAYVSWFTTVKTLRTRMLMLMAYIKQWLGC
ncbi:hypothetical protein PILCRDRAFT_7500 [Piloderma croceum F 1598]|uniref:Uncharacterized protein n=1 Tax=Piloderma croceum (strain F 1598) TaxID=765440 RepID=A0A0C3FWW2_PILCF|nr:hypothetical protein PILCRDRAFT_7500 [Piloderma croceum F 1598]